MLFRHGSNPDLMPEPHRAGQSKKTPFTDLLAKVTSFRYAVSLGRISCIRAMLDAGAISQLRGEKAYVKEVLLQAATLTDKPEVVVLLLDEGIGEPAYAAAFAARGDHELSRAALEETVRRHGLNTEWSRHKGGTRGSGPQGWSMESAG